MCAHSSQAQTYFLIHFKSEKSAQQAYKKNKLENKLNYFKSQCERD